MSDPTPAWQLGHEREIEVLKEDERKKKGMELLGR